MDHLLSAGRSCPSQQRLRPPPLLARVPPGDMCLPSSTLPIFETSSVHITSAMTSAWNCGCRCQRFPENHEGRLGDQRPHSEGPSATNTVRQGTCDRSVARRHALTAECTSPPSRGECRADVDTLKNLHSNALLSGQRNPRHLSRDSGC